MRVLSSLRARLALWLLLPLSLFVALCGWLNWRNAAALADYVQDHDLLASAKVLAERLIWEGDAIQATVPPSALSLFRSEAHDQVFLSVTDSDGRLLAGSPNFPLPAQMQLQGVDQAQWYDTQFEGQPLRAVITRRDMYEVGGGHPVTITVSKTTGSRDHMLRALFWPSMEFLLLALALAILLATLALTWELRPVLRLRQQLAQRDPLRLDFEVDTRGLHSELRPVADTLNRFVAQLRAHSEAQRRFIADAAHQLRTPLALQASQIEFARYAREHRKNWDTRREDMDTLWREMQASNRRLIVVTNKLLLLAQAEHADVRTRLVPLDLGQAALRVVEQLAALADRRGIDLGLDLPEGGEAVQVMAEPALLDALVSNLLDNALRYTQEGGRVTVGLRALSEGGAELTVEDNGPGIAPEALPRVFERFYRAAGDTEGSGLGLAIVREITEAFGATVELLPAAPRGLRAEVRWTG